MKDVKDSISELREFFIEYKDEFIFGFVLLGCVVLSYMLAPLIPKDIFYLIIFDYINFLSEIIQFIIYIILFILN